jgi:hypothetical protein
MLQLKKLIEGKDKIDRDRIKQALYHLRFAKKNVYSYLEDKPTTDGDAEAFLEADAEQDFDHGVAARLIADLDDLIGAIKQGSKHLAGV